MPCPFIFGGVRSIRRESGRRLLFLLTAMMMAGCSGPQSEPSPEGTPPEPRTKPSTAEQIGGHTPRQIIALFGAREKAGVTARQMAGYRRVFGFGDANGDGKLSRKEYVDDGRYMTRQARQGIFRASDANGDGFVTEAEYVENRIITDEAKEIFGEMDENGDRKLTLEEVVSTGKLKDEMAGEVFRALDSNGNGELVIPEFLRVWGRWARDESSLDARSPD